MTTFTEIIDAAKFTSDLVNIDRVNLSEWRTLVSDSIRSAWRIAASVRPDFQVATQDSTLTSGGTASFAVPARFEAEIDVVYAPDTDAEYSLGRFAWQNRRSPGGWLPLLSGLPAAGGMRARLMGSTVYIEPSRQAGGTYRLWYLPKPAVPEASHTVRLATTASLNATGLGVGVGKMLTANVNGTLVIDGQGAFPGDRVLVKDQPTGFASNNGIYAVTSIGSGGSPWIMTRATDYDANSEIAIGNMVAVTEGTVNANTMWALTSFGGSIDVDAMVFTAGAIDDILVPFKELLVISAALPAIDRDDDLPIQRLENRRAALEAEMREYFLRTRTANLPTKPIDTDMRGPAIWGGW